MQNLEPEPLRSYLWPPTSRLPGSLGTYSSRRLRTRHESPSVFKKCRSDIQLKLFPIMIG